MGRAPHRLSGLSLVDVVVGLGVFVIFLVTVTAITGSQRAFLQSRMSAELRLRAQNAMERVVRMTTQAITSDSQYSPLKSNTGVNSHCLRFRLLQFVDPVSGAATFDDALKVFIYGPHSTGAHPNSGLIVGRGQGLTAIFNAGNGPDGLLGTADDNTTVVLSGDVPAVELLIPSDYAPQTGDMFTVNISPAPTGRLITYTIRVNAAEPDGTFVLDQDLVLTERVSLRECGDTVRRCKRSSEQGITLLDVVMAIGVFSIISTSVFLSLITGMDHRRQSFQVYRALNVLRDKVAEVQDVANLPQDLAAQEGIGAIYARYHSTTVTAPDLPSGQVSITCFPNEATVPAALGGPQDLNFDGDDDDDLGNMSNGTDLRLVPMTITVSFTEDGVTQTRTANHLITKTTD